MTDAERQQKMRHLIALLDEAIQMAAELNAELDKWDAILEEKLITTNV